MSKNSASESDVRQQMKEFWEIYKAPTVESMMCNSQAPQISENEIQELLSYLPNLKGVQLLELGAGIGRYTTRFAATAGHVTAVDFMESYLAENQKVNGHLTNVKFICGDASKIDFPPESFDVVFINWLFMYLSQSESESLMKKILEWLKPSGYFFFRESCYHKCGNILPENHPTIFRTPLDYFDILNNSSSRNNSGFEPIFAKSILTFTEHYGNPNQVCFLARKTTPKSAFKSIELQQNFDIFSKDKEFVKDLTMKLDAKPNHRVLNVGCGVEGSWAFSICELSSCFVHSLDSSPVKIHEAIFAQSKKEVNLKKKIQFEFRRDIVDVDLESSSFDCVLSLVGWKPVSTLDFIQQEIKLMKKWLKTGGKMVFSCFVGENFPTFCQVEKLLQSEFVNVVMEESNSILLRVWKKFNSSEKEVGISKCDYFERRMANLIDGKLDWLIVTVTK